MSKAIRTVKAPTLTKSFQVSQIIIAPSPLLNTSMFYYFVNQNQTFKTGAAAIKWIKANGQSQLTYTILEVYTK